MTTNGLHTDAAPRQPVDLSLEDAKALLEGAVDKKGRDFRYTRTTPTYFDPDTGECSCLVGYVLAEKGITSLPLDLNGADVYALIRCGVLRVDEDTQHLLDTAQTEQDQGQTWGEALDEALTTYEVKAADARRFHASYDYFT